MTKRAQSEQSWSRLPPEVWWVALGVLIANDHWLKGAALLPGWFTGKASDVAGLLVAPWVVAALFTGFVQRARQTFQKQARATRSHATRSHVASVVFAHVLVGAGFAALQWQPSADAIVSALAQLSIRWHVWPDPTDLFALPALLLSWRWMTSPRVGRRDGRPRPRHAALRFAAVAIGGVACLATSSREHTAVEVSRPEDFATLRKALAEIDAPTACHTWFDQVEAACAGETDTNCQQRVAELREVIEARPEPESLARACRAMVGER